MKKDDSMEDWTIPLTEIPAARTLKLAGTEIVVSPLKKEVADLLSSPRFESDLARDISRVYTFLVGKHLRIWINDIDVKPFSIPVGKPRQGQTSYEEFKGETPLKSELLF